MPSRPRPTKSWFNILEGRNHLKQEVCLTSSGEKQQCLVTQIREYSLGPIILMFWPSFPFFSNTVPSLSFFFFYPLAQVFLLYVNRENFLPLRCFLFSSPRWDIAHFSKQHLQCQVAQHFQINNICVFPQLLDIYQSCALIRAS